MYLSMYFFFFNITRRKIWLITLHNFFFIYVLIFLIRQFAAEKGLFYLIKKQLPNTKMSIIFLRQIKLYIFEK